MLTVRQTQKQRCFCWWADELSLTPWKKGDHVIPFVHGVRQKRFLTLLIPSFGSRVSSVSLCFLFPLSFIHDSSQHYTSCHQDDFLRWQLGSFRNKGTIFWFPVGAFWTLMLKYFPIFSRAKGCMKCDYIYIKERHLYTPTVILWFFYLFCKATRTSCVSLFCLS